MMGETRHDAEGPRDVGLRARNTRLGLILASVALVFFLGIIVKYTLLR